MNNRDLRKIQKEEQKNKPKTRTKQQLSKMSNRTKEYADKLDEQVSRTNLKENKKKIKTND